MTAGPSAADYGWTFSRRAATVTVVVLLVLLALATATTLVFVYGGVVYG